MKMLLIHADFIEWVPTKKALKSAEGAEKVQNRAEETLVAFTAVEKRDDKNPKAVAKNAVKEILDVYNKVHAKNVVLYPYAHLSSDLGSPDKALSLLKDIESGVKKKVPVKRAVFGWYKAFNLKAKGHPLAELSKEITAKGIHKGDDEISDALKKEETLKSDWYILEPSGKKHKIVLKKNKLTGFNFSKHKNLEKLAHYEIAKSRLVKEEPPHMKLMKRLGIAGHEPGSDPGNLRFPPNGRLIKGLIEDYVTRKTVDYGAMEIETPVMYDFEHPSLKSYMHRFPARQYAIETPNKKVFLRFAACFGSFLMAKDASISYRNLPMRIYEMTRYSFRVEQHGELAGLRRLRAFTMPDCHAFCRDLKQVKEEMITRMELSKTIQKDLGFDLHGDLEFALRVVKDFHNENKPFIMKLVKNWGRPILLEEWDKRFFYFILKYEFNFIDALDKAAALNTDQLDVENAERYGLLFTDKDNRKKHPLILHLSPSGAIERVLYAILEKKFLEQRAGKNPVFPLWLSPTQIRLCPINDSLVEYTEKIADTLAEQNIRVDVDDRAESVSKKIRDGETEWIPFVVVVGDKEKKSGKLAVRFRDSSKVKQMSVKNIINEIKKQTDGMPYRPLALPKLLTKRPVWVA
jgi:threonyl-tRNA synthetase